MTQEASMTNQWEVARMAARLGANVVLCAAIGLGVARYRSGRSRQRAHP